MQELTDIIVELYHELEVAEIPEPDKIKMLQGSVNESLSALTDEMLVDLRARSHFMLSEHKFLSDEFNARLRCRWFEPFDLLYQIIVISQEIGEGYAHDHTDNRNKAGTYLLEILIALHGRAIQIAREILTLMKNGYADGAFARWRTLYEISVIALFISKHGEETAKRYSTFIEVENYKEMETFNKLCSDDAEKIYSLPFEERKKEIISEYGNDFYRDYGWTSNVLSKKEINFKGIEESIQHERFRPYYKWACNTVHAGPKAAYYRIGKYENKHLILAGPSNYGMAVPGSNTGISLLHITTTLVTNLPSFDTLLSTNALYKLVTELSEKFERIQKQIEIEEEQQNGKLL